MDVKTALFYKDYEILEKTPKKFLPGAEYKRLIDGCVFSIKTVFFDTNSKVITVSLYLKGTTSAYSIQFFEFRLSYEHCGYPPSKDDEDDNDPNGW